MTEPNDPPCGCSGCVVKKDGVAATPGVSQSWGASLLDTNGSAIATVKFVCTPHSGTCRPEDCAPQTPCKIQDPELLVTDYTRTLEIKVTNAQGPVSPDPQQFNLSPSGNPPYAPYNEALKGIGGDGTHFDGVNGYRVPLGCGGTPMSWTIAVRYFDLGLQQRNTQSVVVTLECSKCEVAPS